MTFIPYTPNANCTQVEKPPTRRVTFGDGYEQVSQSGLQPITRRWSATFSNFDRAGANAFLAVLRAARGVEPVQWQSPEDDEPQDYLVIDWQTQAMAGQIYEVTVNMESYFS